MNRLLRLYPAAWRDRYGAEFEVLLADRPPGVRDRIDIVRGALDARLRPQLARSEDGNARPTWHPTVVAAAIIGGLLFVVGSSSLASQSADAIPYRDGWIMQYTAWIGALLIAVGPLRAISVTGRSPVARPLFPLAAIAAFMIVGPWPIVAFGFYLFLVVCLTTAIAMTMAEGPVWLGVVVASLVASAFNTEDDRAWLLVPFGLAWIVVGLLHLARMPAAEEPRAPTQPEVAVP